VLGVLLLLLVVVVVVVVVVVIVVVFEKVNGWGNSSLKVEVMLPFPAFKFS